MDVWIFSGPCSVVYLKLGILAVTKKTASTINQDAIALFNLNTCLVLILQTKGFFNVTSLALMPFFDLAINWIGARLHAWCPPWNNKDFNVQLVLPN